MSRSIAFVIPGAIASRSGGYEFDRQMIAGLRRRGWLVDVREISGSFPRPTPDALAAAAESVAAIPDGCIVVVDGLAFGAMPEIAVRDGGRLRFVSIVHLPLALEVGLDRVSAEQFRTSERRALEAASSAVATGRSTRDALIANYGVSPERVHLVEPGTHAARPARGSSPGEGVHLLCVAAVTRGKGHDVLVQALARIQPRGWRLTCAGSIDRDRAHVAAVRNLVAAAHLTDQIALIGEVDGQGLESLYDMSDVFVLATRRETYGMAVAEALAHALPVVSTTTGEIPNLVGRDAGIVVQPGDVDELARALRRIIEDRSWRESLRDGARSAGRRLRTWDESVDRFIAVLERVAADERIAF